MKAEFITEDNMLDAELELEIERIERESTQELFCKLLRAQCDEIMTIIGADADLPYSELAANVRAVLKGDKYVPKTESV